MQEARIWVENGLTYIDVSEMEPPTPLFAVLELIERPDCGNDVVVIHNRDPIYLFSELVERNWSWVYLDHGPPEVRLHLSRCKT